MQLKRSSSFHRQAFTLVELLVVLSIIGVLVSLSLPAVQSVRESARQTVCRNRLKNIGVALFCFESAESTFPHGASFSELHSWGSEILPFVEQTPLHNRLDFEKSWNDIAGNWEVAQTDLELFSCPSSDKDYRGKTDYCGISGSWRSGFHVNGKPNGLLFPNRDQNGRPVSIREVSDGTSNTMFVSEGSETFENNDGFWASGYNCFTHEEGPVNAPGRPANEIVSDHPSIAVALFCDGSVRSLSNTMPATIVAALCTRNGAEMTDSF